MEFEDHEELAEDIGLPASASYDALGNSSRAKTAISGGGNGGGVESTAAAAVAAGLGHGKSASRYRECLKNHAVSIGGHAVDGCCEFMPAGVEGSLDALKCAACNCHRNFHRKVTDGGGGEVSFHHHHPHFSPYYHAPYLHIAAQHQRPLALPLPSTSGGGVSPGDDQDDVSNNPSGGGGGSAAKKRFRTRFTQEQKDKMLAFAERLGWRIQKHDEADVQQFCTETSVKRHVLKVWMHNNKNTLGKKP